ncbi:MAG TPA: 30S ribosomal protein S16 [Actinomycetota bacterium]|jgi:small subunit ribosomal protein S16|nr:30S ribosomal protein S16 [Actinomycetota bacterium]
MVKIRLKRVGKVKQPSYRVVVADSRRARDGRIIEAIGHYNPRADPSIVEIDGERALHWLERGAQPSDQVRKLLQITGAWQTFTGEGAPAPAPAPGSVKATPAASVEESPEETVADTSGAEVSQAAVDADAEEGVEAGVTPEADVSEEDRTEQ